MNKVLFNWPYALTPPSAIRLFADEQTLSPNKKIKKERKDKLIQEKRQ